MKKINDKIIIEYSSVALKGNDWRRIIDEGLEACAEYGFELGVQMHNTSEKQELERIAELGIRMSFHAPIMSEHQINLAAEDFEPALKILEANAALMKDYAVSEAVFHGFNMTDKAIPSFGNGRDYKDSYGAIYRPELSLKDSMICSNFFETEEYHERRQRVSERLKLIREVFRGFDFLLENDFPCYGAGSIFAEHIATMGHPLCMDSSHLWTSAFVFDRVYHTEVEAFLKSGLVRMSHIHASPYTSAIPKAQWSDGHKPFSIKNDMDLPRYIQLCRKYSMRHFIFEINGLSRADIDFLAAAWNAEEQAPK